MKYRIQTSDGKTYAKRFGSISDAAGTYADWQGWVVHVVSSEYSVGHDNAGIERYACSVYETQRDCDADAWLADTPPHIIQCGAESDDHVAAWVRNRSKRRNEVAHALDKLGATMRKLMAEIKEGPP